MFACCLKSFVLVYCNCFYYACIHIIVSLLLHVYNYIHARFRSFKAYLRVAFRQCLYTFIIFCVKSFVPVFCICFNQCLLLSRSSCSFCRPPHAPLALILSPCFSCSHSPPPLMRSFFFVLLSRSSSSHAPALPSRCSCPHDPSRSSCPHDLSSCPHAPLALLLSHALTLNPNPIACPNPIPCPKHALTLNLNPKPIPCLNPIACPNPIAFVLCWLIVLGCCMLYWACRVGLVVLCRLGWADCARLSACLYVCLPACLPACLLI